jgi:nucleotide-binding universal stress UspA family protein
MFSVIVVGTDGSETAGAAVELAVELARQSRGKLHLVAGIRSLGAVVVPVGGVHAADPSGPFRREAMQRMLDNVAVRIEGIAVETHVAEGDPAEVVVRRADEVGADLIVVGSKGMRGTRRILGSVPNSVAHKAGCHVLVAKTV